MEQNEITQGNKTMIAKTPDGDATVLGTTVKCPVCGTENSPSEKYCGDCGFLLSSTPGEPVAAEGIEEQAKLVDPQRQREFMLRVGQNTVGREAADVLLDDPTVSRKHAVVTIDETGCHVEDLGSTNGTYVDGVQVRKGERKELADGSEIKFGNTVLVLQLPAAVLSAQPESSEGCGAAEVQAEKVTEAREEPVEEPVAAPEEVEPIARLVLVSDPSIAFGIKPGANRLGRKPDSDIPITSDGYVSGVHCDILAENGNLYVTDLGSTNGTFVNGEKIAVGQKVPLKDGDEITVGQTILRLQVLHPEIEDEEVL